MADGGKRSIVLDVLWVVNSSWEGEVRRGQLTTSSNSPYNIAEDYSDLSLTIVLISFTLDESVADFKDFMP